MLYHLNLIFLPSCCSDNKLVPVGYVLPVGSARSGDTAQPAEKVGSISKGKEKRGGLQGRTQVDEVCRGCGDVKGN